MASFRSRRPSPAIAVAILALVAAVAGTAVAADPVATTAKLSKKDKRKVRKIARKIAKRKANKRITERAPTLAVGHANTAGSANTAKTANSANTSRRASTAATANVAGTASTVLNGAVTTPKLASNAVTDRKIADGQVRSPELGPVRVVKNAVSIHPNERGSVSADCAPEELLLSGGANFDPIGGDQDVLLGSHPNEGDTQPPATGWTATAANGDISGESDTLEVWALCLEAGVT